MGEETELVEVNDVAIIRNPTKVLAEAREAAKALKDVVSGKPKKVMIGGEQYLEFEDWQTVGRFYGVSAKVMSTGFIDLGGVQGFEARAVAIRNSDGMEVSAAEAMCLNDEDNWKKKPLFQLKSMAQTRASAKALRNVLAWVVVLAGYRPTPAEEMDGVKGNKPPIAEPQKKAPEPKPESGKDPFTRTAILGTKEFPAKKEGANPSYRINGHLGGNEQSFWTFSKTFYELAKSEEGTGMMMDIEYTIKLVGDQTYHNIVSLNRVEPDGNAQV